MEERENKTHKRISLLFLCVQSPPSDAPQSLSCTLSVDSWFLSGFQAALRPGWLVLEAEGW